MADPRDDLDALKTRLGGGVTPPSRADDLDAMRTRVERSGPDADPAVGPAPSAGALLPPDQLPPGFLLDGRLMVVRQVGHGAMGVVYEVIDTRTQARYAAKLLNAALAGDQEAIDLMAREVASAQAVTHQNLLKVNYFADSGPYKYLVMEYLAGADLATHMARRGGKLPVEEGLKILRQAAAGLDHLHSKGLVHQDVKPPNIFVTAGGEVRVLDYGIAKVVRAHGAPGAQASGGTLAYMSPEQLRGETVDRRADVYAFGLVSVELLTGKLPFDVRDAKAVVAWHVNANHSFSGVDSPALRKFAETCLATNPAARPSDLSALRDEKLGSLETPTSSPREPPKEIAEGRPVATPQRRQEPLSVRPEVKPARSPDLTFSGKPPIWFVVFAVLLAIPGLLIFSSNPDNLSFWIGGWLIGSALWNVAIHVLLIVGRPKAVLSSSGIHHSGNVPPFGAFDLPWKDISDVRLANGSLILDLKSGRKKKKIKYFAVGDSPQSLEPLAAEVMKRISALAE